MKFSILIPAFKIKFLKEAIDSVVLQSCSDWELVIVDDASPQNVHGVVEKYQDHRIHYYRNKIGFGAEHVVGNWNKCLEYATGDYVICMGDDDKLLPNCLDEYSRLISEYPNMDLYHGQTLMIDENSKIVDVQDPRPVKESMLSIMYYRWFGNRNQYIGDWLFRRDVLVNRGGFTDLPFAWESDDCSAFVAARKTGVANTQVPVFMYRVSCFTISSNTSNNKDKILAHYKAAEICKDLIYTTPTDDLDIFYQSQLLSKFEKHLSKVITREVGSDILAHPLRIFYWLVRGKNYHVNKKNVCKSIIYAFQKSYALRNDR